MRPFLRLPPGRGLDLVAGAAVAALAGYVAVGLTWHDLFQLEDSWVYGPGNALLSAIGYWPEYDFRSDFTPSMLAALPLGPFDLAFRWLGLPERLSLLILVFIPIATLLLAVYVSLRMFAVPRAASIAGSAVVLASPFVLSGWQSSAKLWGVVLFISGFTLIGRLGFESSWPRRIAYLAMFPLLLAVGTNLGALATALLFVPAGVAIHLFVYKRLPVVKWWLWALIPPTVTAIPVVGWGVYFINSHLNVVSSTYAMEPMLNPWALVSQSGFWWENGGYYKWSLPLVESPLWLIAKWTVFFVPWLVLLASRRGLGQRQLLFATASTAIMLLVSGGQTLLPFWNQVVNSMSAFLVFREPQSKFYGILGYLVALAFGLAMKEMPGYLHGKSIWNRWSISSVMPTSVAVVVLVPLTQPQVLSPPHESASSYISAEALGASEKLLRTTDRLSKSHSICIALEDESSSLALGTVRLFASRSRAGMQGWPKLLGNNEGIPCGNQSKLTLFINAQGIPTLMEQRKVTDPQGDLK